MGEEEWNSSTFREKRQQSRVSDRFRVRGSVWLRAECFVIPGIKRLKWSGQHSTLSSCLDTHWSEIYPRWETYQQKGVILLFFVSHSLRHATGLFMWRKTLKDRRARAAISGKLIVVYRNVIVVADRVLSSPVQEVPGGMEGRDGKTAGGRSLTQTEESLYWCGA